MNRFQKAPLGGLVQIKGGKRLPLGEDFSSVPTSHPYIRARDIGSGLIKIQEAVFLPDSIAQKLWRYKVSKGDVCITIVGANVGAMGVVPPELDGANLTENAVRLTTNGKVAQEYLRYALLSDDAMSQMKVLAGGAAQPKLGIYKIETIEIPLPPSLSTQRKIAGVLSAYDDLIENNTRRIAILEEMAQAIYREWFVNFRFPGHEKVKLINSPLGKIPEGWKVSPLKEVYRTSSGGTPSRKVDEYYEGGSINWVKTKELDDRFIWETEEKITEEGLANSSAKVFPANTVIMAMYGATIGQLGILGAEASTNQACCGFLTTQSEYGYPYLYLNLLSNRNDIINLRAGAAQQNVSQDVIREIPFLVPSLPTVREFNELVEPFLQGVFRLQKKNSNLRTTRDLLLPKLISGKLDVEELDIDTGEPLVEAEA